MATLPNWYTASGLSDLLDVEITTEEGAVIHFDGDDPLPEGVDPQVRSLAAEAAKALQAGDSQLVTTTLQGLIDATSTDPLITDSALHWFFGAIKVATQDNSGKATYKTLADLIDSSTNASVSENFVRQLIAAIPAGLTDAPSDGKLYGRKNAAWSEVTGGGHSDYDYVSSDRDVTTAALGANLTIGYSTLTPSTPTPAVDQVIADSTLHVFARVTAVGVNNCDAYVFAVIPTPSGGNDVTAIDLSYNSAKIEAKVTLNDGTEVDSTPEPLTAEELIYKSTDSKTIAQVVDALGGSSSQPTGVTDVLSAKGSLVTDGVAMIPNFDKTGQTKLPNPDYYTKSDGSDWDSFHEFLDEHADEHLVTFSRNKWMVNSNSSPAGKTFKLASYYEANLSSFSTTAAQIRTFDFNIPNTPPSSQAVTMINYGVWTYNQAGTLIDTGKSLSVGIERLLGKYDLAIQSTSTVNLITQNILRSSGDIDVDGLKFSWEKESDYNGELICKGFLLKPKSSALPQNAELLQWLGGTTDSAMVAYDGGAEGDATHSPTVTVPATEGLFTEDLYTELKGGGALDVGKATLYTRRFYAENVMAQDTSLNTFSVEFVTTNIAQNPTDLDQLISLLPVAATIHGVSIDAVSGAQRPIVGFGNNSGHFRAQVINPDATTSWVDFNAGASIQPTSSTIAEVVTSVKYK